MSVKRRDHKNRILRSGESQRKDGRYAYKYVDAAGQPQFVYSWKLEKTDPLPAGKRDCVALREKEKKIQKDLEDGISSNGGNLTVVQLAEKYMRQSAGLARNTIVSYDSALNKVRRRPFGTKKIKDIKVTDGKFFLISLNEEGVNFGSLNTLKSVLKNSFQMAIDDNLVRINPFDFNMADIVRNTGEKRDALTPTQERDFLEYVKKNKRYSKYYDAIYILFNTGMRVSEFAALTLSDLDFKNRKIFINNQLQRTKTGVYSIEETKSDTGRRVLPMLDDVYACFKRIIENRKPSQIEYVVGGKSGFLLFNKIGKPLATVHWDSYFKGICKMYNNEHEIKMPRVTPHVCRHTYCTKMVKKKVNIKILQYLMGHANAATTLNIYSHVNFEDAQAEIEECLMIRAE